MRSAGGLSLAQHVPPRSKPKLRLLGEIRAPAAAGNADIGALLRAFDPRPTHPFDRAGLIEAS